MKSTIGKLYWIYSSFWQTHVPVKPKYGNYYGRGWNNRWRKKLK